MFSVLISSFPLCRLIQHVQSALLWRQAQTCDWLSSPSFDHRNFNHFLLFVYRCCSMTNRGEHQQHSHRFIGQTVESRPIFHFPLQTKIQTTACLFPSCMYGAVCFLFLCSFLIRVTDGAGVYPSGHWARAWNAPWTGHQCTRGSRLSTSCSHTGGRKQNKHGENTSTPRTRAGNQTQNLLWCDCSSHGTYVAPFLQAALGKHTSSIGKFSWKWGLWSVWNRQQHSQQHLEALATHRSKHFDSQALLIWSHLPLQVLICQQHRTFPVTGITAIQPRLEMLLIPAGVLKFNSAFYKTSKGATMLKWRQNGGYHVLMREKTVPISVN